MQAFSMKSSLAAVVALGAAVVLGPAGGHAAGDPPAPKPKIDCSKAANKNKPQCKNASRSNTDEVYSAGYLLAKEGKYAEAIQILKTADDQADPRILNYLGFASRKLGDVETALGYYTRALEVNPNYTVARAYMGEAFLQKGDALKAKEQLAEIEKRCGRACAEFAELDGHIKNFEKTGVHKG